MTGLPLYLVEPEALDSRWSPFAGARPVAELRAGAFRIADRWRRALDPSSVELVAPLTPNFADVASFPLATGPIVGPAIVARSTVVPLGALPALPPGTRGLSLDGRTVAWLLEAGEQWAGSVELVDPLPFRGFRLDSAVDLITATERVLEDDCAGFLHEPNDGVPPAAIVLGDPAWVVVRGATVEPHVVFDVRKGPVVLEPHAVVRAGTRLEGPLYVGAHSWILGGALRNSSIGPHCRVHGEVASSIFFGYANKSHDGFLGHSIVGQWVNLGAGTITSNLKNTYGEIRLQLPDTRLDTGRTNLGTIFGDHVKTAIGTLLSTGTVLGTGANVFGGTVPPYVPPFAWGVRGSEKVDAQQFITIAKRIMPRRGIDVTQEIEASLLATHARLAR